ncbi:hypothetical protein H4219_006141, partial [Mycoemilia scoparia]
MQVPILAVVGFKFPIILGLPFLEQADWKVVRDAKGDCVYQLTDGVEFVTFPTTISIKNRLEHMKGKCCKLDVFEDEPDRYYAMNLVCADIGFGINAAKYKPV